MCERDVDNAAETVPQKKRVLVVDNSTADRTQLRDALQQEYSVAEVENGEMALCLLRGHSDHYAAVIMELSLPAMGGRAVLQEIHQSALLQNMPVIVVTAQADEETEQECLELGAWDFLKKPCNGCVLRSRLKNILAHQQLTEMEKNRYLSEHDPLTGFFNRDRFLRAVDELLDAHTENKLALIHIDLDRFRLFNSFFGAAEGDHLLQYIAKCIREMCAQNEIGLYGRMDSDVFGICIDYKKEELLARINTLSERISAYNTAYHVEPSVGIYCVQDNTIRAEAMFARATMAANRCKNQYRNNTMFYDEGMTKKLLSEQGIMHDAQQAIEGHQFVVYLQPKYDVRTEMPCGAEALVRWDKPGRGVLSPAAFVPIFEGNGYITVLDHYMWEQTCILLRKWLDAGLRVLPVSVNISRANMYNTHLAETLTNLIEKYQLPSRLLELELTESAYMDNPDLMRDIVANLRKKGFTVLMDDFGSGYSSLNTLKDIDVDILKVDMKFLSAGENNEKSERILASIIRMASWLNLTVVVEGVETESQKVFLESVGCNFIQGYYYAKPMPAEKYEQLLRAAEQVTVSATEKAKLDDDLIGSIWNFDPEVSRMFQQLPNPAAICRYVNDEIQPLCMNDSLRESFGYTGDAAQFTEKNNHCLAAEDTVAIDEMFRQALKNKNCAACVYKYMEAGRPPRWIWINVQYFQAVLDGAAFLATFIDITKEQALRAGFDKYRAVVQDLDKERTKLLVVDDSGLSRKMAVNVFHHKFEVLEAENGEKGLALLRENAETTAIVLLDMIMPGMDGKKFLQKKNEDAAIADIPVIIVSSVSSHSSQEELKKMGVSDMVSKPYIPQILERHVENAIHNACFIRRRKRA